MYHHRCIVDVIMILNTTHDNSTNRYMQPSSLQKRPQMKLFIQSLWSRGVQSMNPECLSVKKEPGSVFSLPSCFLNVNVPLIQSVE